MILRCSFFALLSIVPVSCASSASSEVQHYGAAVPESKPLPVETVLADPQIYDGRELVLEGRVVEVCPVKGCWMTFASGERSLRVTFLDYAFFVPKDCAGATAVCGGRFAIREVPADEARHYLEDAGRHAEAAQITEPVRSYTFVASGVRLSQ